MLEFRCACIGLIGSAESHINNSVEQVSQVTKDDISTQVILVDAHLWSTRHM